jgi:hypothetical protein
MRSDLEDQMIYCGEVHDLRQMEKWAQDERQKDHHKKNGRSVMQPSFAPHKMSFMKYSKTGADPYFLRILPSLYFWGSILFSIYILVVSIYIPFIRLQNHHVFNLRTTIALTCLHSLLFGLLAWSYFRVRLTNPGNIPRPGHLTTRELDALESGKAWIPTREQLLSQDFYACELDGSVRYCHTCKVYRPLRTSHCHNTGRCVVKFDHYCPLLGSAIGIKNYKYYINFLFYMALTAIYLPLIDIFAISIGRKSELTIFLLVFSAFVSVCIVTPLCVTHFKHLIHNTTTKETATISENGRLCGPRIPNVVLVAVKIVLQLKHDAPPMSRHIIIQFEGERAYKRSHWANWTGVMGIRLWEWLLPIAPTSSETSGTWWIQEFNEAAKEKLRSLAKERLLGFNQSLETMRTAGMAGYLSDLRATPEQPVLRPPQPAHFRH